MGREIYDIINDMFLTAKHLEGCSDKTIRY